MPEKKLLIYHQGALGDFVLTFPALTRLKKRFAPLDAVCKPQLGELTQSLGLIDSWFSQDGARFATLFSNTPDPDLKALLNSYDEIILFSFSKDLARSIKKIRNHPVHRIPPRPEPTENIHVALHLLKNLTTRGLIGEENDLHAVENFSPSLRQGVFNNSLNSRKVYLHPGASSQKKMWNLKNFLQLDNLLGSDGYITEYIIGPADEFLTEALQTDDSHQKVVHMPEKILALADLLKTAGGFIGNDSGVSHLAAYLGLPTVTVFGPSDPVMWRPIGAKVAIVRPESNLAPDTAAHTKNAATPNGFSSISPAAVLTALYNLLS